jgi:hypothetical protein
MADEIDEVEFGEFIEEKGGEIRTVIHKSRKDNS